MKISKTPNTTPHSTPPSTAGSQGGADSKARDGHYIWTSLVPRLIHPTKLAIVRALIEAGKPQSVDDLKPYLLAADSSPEGIQCHTSHMVEVDALEVTSIQIKAGDEVPLLFFPQSE